MSSEFGAFDAALGRMGGAIRRAHTAFDEADEAFIQALGALKQITEARGSLEDRITEMGDTIRRLEGLVMEQGETLRQLRAERGGAGNGGGSRPQEGS
jgi:uncharacterized phage infection (PIP) family protein YhgE